MFTLPTGNGDQVLPLEYRNQYPASWAVFAITTTSFQVPFVGIDEDGAPTMRTTTSSVLAWEGVERGNVTVAPVISSVRDLSIDGQPVADAIQATTATPLLSWKRPRHGSPAAYVVRIDHLLAQAPFTQRAGRIVVTPDTHRIRIPSGLFKPGEHYYFQVVAVSSSEPRDRGQLDIMLVPPRAQTVDAFSTTVVIE